MVRRLLPSLLALVIGASPAWSEGLSWVTETTAGSRSPQKAQFFAMPKRMKIVTPEGPTMILRSDEDKLISVNHTDQTYWEMPFSSLEAMSRQMQTEVDSALAQLKDKLKDLPPEQRLMIEKAMGKAKSGKEAGALPVEVRNTGEKRTIGGYACTKYVAAEGGAPIMVAWTTRDVPAFDKLREEWLMVQKRMNETNRSYRSGFAEAYAKIEGFPMETQMGDIKTVVTSVDVHDIAAVEFDPPAGYRKQPPPMPDLRPKP